jgi:hypothetical protein
VFSITYYCTIAQMISILLITLYLALYITVQLYKWFQYFSHPVLLYNCRNYFNIFSHPMLSGDRSVGIIRSRTKATELLVIIIMFNIKYYCGDWGIMSIIYRIYTTGSV